jgi:hypothetical protein
MMSELQVQNTAKNKEKREWKKKIREQKQESNLFRSETTMIKTSSAPQLLIDWNWFFC